MTATAPRKTGRPRKPARRVSTSTSLPPATLDRVEALRKRWRLGTRSETLLRLVELGLEHAPAKPPAPSDADAPTIRDMAARACERSRQLDALHRAWLALGAAKSAPGYRMAWGAYLDARQWVGVAGEKLTAPTRLASWDDLRAAIDQACTELQAIETETGAAFCTTLRP
jgi:hypothetical protein